LRRPSPCGLYASVLNGDYVSWHVDLFFDLDTPRYISGERFDCARVGESPVSCARLASADPDR
jgi:hypothetical protein